ncbi:MAG: hypothetical protein KatS3mg057_1277 [Herpetosiphonaceae bacterium]|nr:MAG: hypothetical protein KatS3mg057_1277 [Herpetosiphonaceae bacterium]
MCVHRKPARLAQQAATAAMPAGACVRWRLLGKELLRYILVGGATTLFDFGLLNLVLLLFPSMPPVAVAFASGSSYGISLVIAYLWHRSWTFRAPIRGYAVVRRFVVLNLSTVVVNALVTLLLTTTLPAILPLSYILLSNVSKAGATLVSGILNFTGNRVWVFQSTAINA